MILTINIVLMECTSLIKFFYYFSDNDQIEKEVLKNERESTIRYMAPEVLELHRNKTRAALNSIESYKRADIYSFGLVVWELCMGTYMGTSTPKELPKEVRFVK